MTNKMIEYNCANNQELNWETLELMYISADFSSKIKCKRPYS